MFEKLYNDCLALAVKAEMQPAEDTHADVCQLINQISTAWVNDQITDEENDILVDLLK